MKLRHIILSLFVAALTLSATAQKAPTHSGAWWKEKSQVFKEGFVGGYKSGAHHAAGKDTPLSKFGAMELVDGVNKFYGDFRNRNIRIDDALEFVADQLAGVPDDKLNAEILKLRAAAVGAAPED
jgi:hypothetical protein